MKIRWPTSDEWTLGALSGAALVAIGIAWGAFDLFWSRWPWLAIAILGSVVAALGWFGAYLEELDEEEEETE